MRKKGSKLMEVLVANDAAHLLGDILAAQLIDAMEHPDSTKALAEFVNSERAQYLVRTKRRSRRVKPVNV